MKVYVWFEDASYHDGYPMGVYSTMRRAKNAATSNGKRPFVQVTSSPADWFDYEGTQTAHLGRDHGDGTWSSTSDVSVSIYEFEVDAR